MDKWLLNSNVVKVLALLIALLLWLVVHLDNKQVPGSQAAVLPENIYGIAVTPQYDESSYHIQSIEPAEVMITLRGRSSALRKVSPEQYRIHLDLYRYGDGVHTVPLQADGFPNGVEVEVYPPTVRVVLEQKQRKEMPVTIVATGNPAQGYKAGQPIIRPGRVLVTVPSSRLEEIDSVRGEVNVEGANAAVIKQVKLVVYNKQGQEMSGTISNPVVDVEVPITSPFKTMPLQVKIIGLPPTGFSVASFKPSADEVIVYGAQQVLDNLDFYDGLQVDLSTLRKDELYRLDIPLKPQVTQLEPAKLEIAVNVVPSEHKLFQAVPITVIGADAEFETKIVTPDPVGINLLLEGAPSVLATLNIEHLQLIADVSNMPPGKHELTLNPLLPQFVRVAAGLNLRVQAEIAPRQQRVAVTESGGAEDAPPPGSG